MSYDPDDEPNTQADDPGPHFDWDTFEEMRGER